MSGFSPELIDYLEGKISFEEFEKRREERQAREKKDSSNLETSGNVECDTDDPDVPSTSEKVLSKSNANDEDKGTDNYAKRPRSKLPRALRGLMGEANIRFARGEAEEAVLMCMEIIRQAPLAYEPFSTLAMIYEDQGDMEKSLQFELIAAHLNPSDTEEWVRLAEMSLEQDNIKQAIFCYSKALKYNPTNVRYLWERSSLYEQVGEHKLAMDGYRRILNLLSPADGDQVMCHVPEGVPIDITVKMMLCLIHLNILEPVSPMLTSLMEQNPEEMGDLYLDVAEAFMDIGEYNSALPLLSALVCSEKYNLAVVWLRHADCLKALGHMEQAAESYCKVVDMAPLHLDARISLSTLQQQLGHPEKALEALEPMYDPDTLAQDANAAQQELKLLLHRSTLLYSQGKMFHYVDTLLTMLAMLLKIAMNRAQVCLISSSKSGERHLYLIKVSRDKISDTDEQETANSDAKAIFAILTSVLSKDDWWNLLLKAIYALCDLSRYKEGELLVDSSLEYYSFYDDRQKRKELEYFGLSTAILDKNFRKAYNYIRIMLMENVNKPQLWNIFNQVTMHSQDVRHHRFCLRLMLKNPDNLALCVLSGHNAFVSGSFKHALAQYVQAYRIKSDDPMYCLCIGLTFVHMASQKFVLKRHALLVQGFSFLNKYIDLRGPCQETYYNLGRALHQMGLTHFAIHYYQQALELPPLQLKGIDEDQVDLRRDIAFNLSLIYQGSGNIEMARKLLYTHCVI
ncbi:hypothetical protein GDO78_013124 [Eleutherodactylus coqui]|uniref:General transcription factor IIIC subunit 3 n=1 Tax=Eleutherodactylus coqui TaxID=57060 RepID=A0A8J6K403_ELECQ|nr:hypothetical protein GDO78_013124 [Eleutherodactylus coqui]